MANERKNELDITIAGQKRTMRASFEAIEAIENVTGKSISMLVASVNGSDIGVGLATDVVFHGLRGFGDTRLTRQEVGEAIIEEGIIKVGAPILQFLLIAFRGVSVGKSEKAKEA